MRRRLAGTLCAALLTAGSVVLVVSLPPVWARDTGTLQLDAAEVAIATRIENAVSRKGHREVRVSLAVWDARSGRALFRRDAESLRRMASVTKLATTGAALLALGSEHELATEVIVYDEPASGVVAGDLVVVGGGDPGFSEHLATDGVAAEIAALAQQVADAGVVEVRGDLVLDSSSFAWPDRHPDWGFRDGNWPSYSAPVTALSINDACLDVTVSPAGPRLTPSVSAFPRTRLVQFANRLRPTAAKKEHVVSIGPREKDGRVRVNGRIYEKAQPYTASIACVDPVALFGEAFRAALANAGVPVRGEVRIARGIPVFPAHLRDRSRQIVLARHATPLAEAVRVCNTRSQNLYAELILRALGVATDGDGSFEGGARAVRGVLALDDDFRQIDGSGLSRGNQGSADAVGRVLTKIYNSPARIPFMRSLAKAGDPAGTLGKRMRAARFKDRVRAKTGTLRDTSALAGFVRRSDRVLAFAVLSEGTVWRARDLQDAVVDALLER